MEGRKRGREDEEAGGDAGGEISMSIEETNKLRISLGLKPLDLTSSSKEDESVKRHQEEQAKKAKEERARQFKARQDEKKRQRNEDAFLDVKGLGEADEDEDMSTWVEKSRVAEVAKRAEEAYAKRQAEAERARKAAARRDKEGSDGEQDSEEGEAVNGDGTSLAGLKVRHGYEDLVEGETMVLTLADKGILDDKGQGINEGEEDELINVLKFEDKKRENARQAAAPKAKPLWEEDGIRRGLLDKYDEEEAEAALQLGADGNVSAAELKRREEVKKKLAEGAGKLLESAAVGVLAPASAAPVGPSGDYYTESEMADKQQEGFKKRDKKKRKERKIREKGGGDAEGDGDTSSLVEQLEAAAELQGAAALSELGTRGGRATARERAGAALREQEAANRAKFEAAVAKGNWASQALKPQAQSSIVGEEDLEDRELQESLERARRLAMTSKNNNKNTTTAGSGAGAAGTSDAAGSGAGDMAVDGGDGIAGGGGGVGGGGMSTVEQIARSAAKAREEEEARIKRELIESAKVNKDRVVNDTMEFVRNIQTPVVPPTGTTGLASVMGTSSRIPPPPPGGPPGATSQTERDDYMDLDMDEDTMAAGTASMAAGWTSAAPSAAGASGAETGRGVTGGGRAGRQLRKAGGAGGAGGGDDMQSDDVEGEGSEEAPEDSGVGDKKLGRGLAGALAMLKDKGELGVEKQMSWAGRTNDRSKNALQGLLGDVYAGGGHEDRLARSIEAALTTKDEFGRVMTPKERFRQLCYDFHGIKPSKNKEATRLKKAAEEIARRKNATSEVNESAEVEGLGKVTEKVAQPFVVLQGKGAMDSLKAMTGDQSGAGSMLPPPPRKPNKQQAKQVPGNLTPLLGDKKVEAMLGIKKPK